MPADGQTLGLGATRPNHRKPVASTIAPHGTRFRSAPTSVM